MGRNTNQFQQMLSQVRAGNPAAISQFVSEYEPYIRRTVRFRLARSSLNPVADSVDVCQSVFGSFLVRLVAGEYELPTEEDLSKLLYSIANHKFLALQRHELAMRRDRRQTVSLNQCIEMVDERQATPERSLSLSEMLTEFECSLEEDERVLYLLRKQGYAWNEIATQLSKSPVVLRKRLSRAVKRVALELGIDE